MEYGPRNSRRVENFHRSQLKHVIEKDEGSLILLENSGSHYKVARVIPLEAERAGVFTLQHPSVVGYQLSDVSCLS